MTFIETHISAHTKQATERGKRRGKGRGRYRGRENQRMSMRIDLEVLSSFGFIMTTSTIDSECVRVNECVSMRNQTLKI